MFLAASFSLWDTSCAMLKLCPACMRLKRMLTAGLASADRL